MTETLRPPVASGPAPTAAASQWTRQPPKSWPGDARGLAAALAANLEGEVHFDAGSRALYATDASNYRQVPIGVVFPKSIDDVLATVDACRRFDAPLLNRGGGTSLAGQCCNLAVVVDWTRHLHGIVAIDPDRRTARVQPGLVLDALRAATVTRHRLAYGPDPSTHSHCTFGGMIGNDSCGVHSVIAGRTLDNVEELDLLLYDGTRLRVGATPPEELSRIYAVGGRRAALYRGLAALAERYGERIRERYPDIPRRVSGYSLPELLAEKGFHVARALVGSEGTLATVLEATVRLVDWAPCRTLLVVGFADVFTAADHVPAVLESGPLGLEGIDGKLVLDNAAKGMNARGRELLPEGDGFLLVEVGGATPAEAKSAARAAEAKLRRIAAVQGIAILTTDATQSAVWHLRESGLGSSAWVPGRSDTWEGWEDSAVAPARLGSYLRELRRLLDQYGYRGDLYGHFGQGCVHTRISFDLYTAGGIERYRHFVDDAADLCLAHGGSLSGEHGDGQSRGELLPKMYGEELAQAFRELKALFDPDNRMNPGKVCEPYPIVSNLRLGPQYEPWEPQTQFRFPADRGQLSRAALRCVGVGKCRRLDGGTMCPSYMVTHEEKHSTRGRAHLLHEMMVGEVIRDGWRSQEVAEALDLCLSCKGCKGDCPVQVDVATYKAEFLHHHYKGRLRPRSAYAMGLIRTWAGIASRVPWLANAALTLPGVGTLAKTLGGIARERDLPRFASPTFRQRFARLAAAGRTGTVGGRRVILYADTFTNFLEPGIAEAAVEVLVAAGFHVELPKRQLCCGRPLYDYGWLPRARRLLEENVAALREAARAGVPIVGLEPSCVATFRDELRNMLPDDPDAERLAKGFFTLAELLERHAPEWEPPPLRRTAVVHGHCHHKAIMETAADQRLLDRMGLDADVLDSGCCGLAGSFGFEAAHYAVSMACGERKLLPAIRDAADDVLLLADGFSCRTQIEHGSGRRALHLGEVLRLGLRQARGAPVVEETHVAAAGSRRGAAVTLGGAAAAGFAGLALWRWRRRRRVQRTRERQISEEQP
jgi:FAD/FMN-containing dehydrogenase/Fe-S oxidoreductase